MNFGVGKREREKAFFVVKCGIPLIVYLSVDGTRSLHSLDLIVSRRIRRFELVLKQPFYAKSLSRDNMKERGRDW
jgi:hypothetical protein